MDKWITLYFSFDKEAYTPSGVSLESRRVSTVMYLDAKDRHNPQRVSPMEANHVVHLGQCNDLPKAQKDIEVKVNF